MSAYNVSERQAATRCVDCPKCLATIGEECQGLAEDMATPTHKARCDKFYVERFGQLPAGAAQPGDAPQKDGK